MPIFLGLITLLLLLLLVLVSNTLQMGMRRPRPASDIVPAPDDLQAKYAEGLGRMVSCATVSSEEDSDGAEFAKLRETVAQLFPRFHAQAERMVFGDDCWVYRLPGGDAMPPVMLMSHHDVAPVKDAAAWTHPPFSGRTEDGRIWGRGTVDAKGPLYAQFQALEELLAEGWTPPCDVYLASSHNEEISGDGIPKAVAYFKEKGVSFAMILDEGGAVMPAPIPGLDCEKCAMVAVHEKGRCTVKLEGGAEALETLRERASGNALFRRQLYPEVRAMFEILAPYADFRTRMVYSNLWLFKSSLLKRMSSLNPRGGELTGTTCAFPQPDTAELRYARPEDFQADLAAFRTAAESCGVKTQVLSDEYHVPAALRSQSHVYLRSCVTTVFPQAACAPFLLPMSTDGRHFCDICENVYRFAPIDITNQQFAAVHGTDENINAEALSRAVLFYKVFLSSWK